MIGQSQVTEPLMTALRSERIGHAYLFSGPRGCGKTTSARILARCLNCAEGPTDTPCGTCPSCVELSRDGGGSLDVVEIDAASHGGVDDARDLRERAIFAPARDRFKIFIIDEAHMVTPGGFNALLKIVEEPPPHVKFVFATTEPDKVIGTIRSRTHHYPFRLIAPATLIEYVQSLCDSEGIAVEPGVLPLVVRSGGGSVRDTLSILDQLIAGSENRTVTATRAAGLLGFTHTELLDDVVSAIGSDDSAGAFTATDRVVQTGQDPRRFVEDLLERLRDLIVVSATTVQGAAAVFRGVPEDQLQRMFEQAQVFRRGELSRIADIVSESLDKMSGATAPRLQLELMIARALVERSAQTEGAGGSLAQALGVGGTSAERQPSAPPAQAPPAQAPEAAGPPAAQQGGAPAAGPPAAPAPPAAESTEMNAAEAARAAREFLRTDTAGTASFGRPVTDVLGMMSEKSAQQGSVPGPPSSPVESAGPSSADAPAGDSGSAAPAARGSEAGDVAFSELADMWPELLEEILETDRDAWNAVRVAVPLGLERDVLTIGFASGSDLSTFKSTGAGPLRETILAAVGVRVRYVPKQVPPGSVPPAVDAQPSGQAQQAPRETGDRPHPATEPSGDTEEPHRGGPSAQPAATATAPSARPAPPVDDVLARAEARLSTLQGGAAAPAPQAAPAPAPAPAPGRAPAPEPASGSAPAPGATAAPAPAPEPVDPEFPDPDAYGDPDDDPYGDADGDPYVGAGEPPLQQPAPSSPTASAPTAFAPSASAPSAAPAPSTAPAPPSDRAAEFARAADAPESQEAPPSRPAFTRYGEAVVREVLGAKFIEERPLPTRREG